MSLLRILNGVCSQTRSSPGYNVYPPVQVPASEPTSTDRNGSSEQTQTQFAVPGGQMNFSVPQMGQFLFPPLPLQAANMNYGQGSGMDQNMLSSQLEAHRKFLQKQLEVQLD